MGALGGIAALVLGSVVAVDAIGSRGEAQTPPATVIPSTGDDTTPDVSDDGNIVVFASAPAENGVSTVLVYDRAAGATPTSIGGSQGAVSPRISGDGCTIVWSVRADSQTADAESADPQPSEATSGSSTPGSSTPGSSTSSSSSSTSSTVAGTASGSSVPAGGPAGPAGVRTPQRAPAAQGASLLVADRCGATPPVATPVAADQSAGAFGPAAMSSDGSVLAVSIGSAVLRFERVGAGPGYVSAGSQNGPLPREDGRLVSPTVDVSDDGSVIVFASGPPTGGQPGASGQNEPAPGTASVDRWVRTAQSDPSRDTIDVVAERADQPSLSGDGTTVAYTSFLPVVPPAPSVVVRSGQSPPVTVADGVRFPRISRDGKHVVYEGVSGGTGITSSTGNGPAAFTTVDTKRGLSGIASPAIDRFGTTVVSATAAPRDIVIDAAGAAASFGSATYAMGSGDLGAELTATLDITNDGPASYGVGSLTIDDDRFVVVADGCGSVIGPGSTCTVDVSYTVRALGVVAATVTVAPTYTTTTGAVALTAGLTATGAKPAAPTTTGTGGSTGASTGGSSSGGRTTSTGGRTSSTGGRTSSTGGRTSSTGGRTSSTGGRTSSSTGGSFPPDDSLPSDLPDPGPGVSVSPAAFEFAPTIVEAGRRTGLVEVVNSSTEPVSVVDVALQPADDGAFAITSTTCVGVTLAAGESCSVDLVFAPLVTGDQSALLVASFGDGVEVTATISGVGAPPPTLSVIPGVATVGQVVTLRGAGFPTGVTVDVTWLDTSIDVAVDDTGGFDTTVVVFPNTPGGPVTASVAALQDQFGEVGATMLVTQTNDPARPGVIDGVGPNVGR